MKLVGEAVGRVDDGITLASDDRIGTLRSPRLVRRGDLRLVNGVPSEIAPPT